MVFYKMFVKGGLFMAHFFVSEEDVIRSIDYFKDLNLDREGMLPIFLISKYLGVSLRKSITFTSLDTNQKSEILKIIWQLGGLQGKDESGGKRVVLFPNAFTENEIARSDLYQPGTEFKTLVSRVKDTVEKVNLNDQLFVDKNKQLTLARDYKEIVSEKYLKGQKISLKHFACWIYRFISFDFTEVTPDQKDFTRVVKKSIKRLFKISKQDFLWIFEDDILSDSITPSSSSISPLKIRNQFNFPESLKPEITTKNTQEVYENTSVNQKEVDKFIQMTGDNPSDKLIFQSLLQTKQIVLTGVPGIGKSRYLKNLKKEFDYFEMIQFHSNYSYEDFIGGDTIEDSTVRSQKGKFLEFIEKAKKEENKEKSFLFIIDELNRGNIAQIFGETILALDREYSVDLAKPIEGIRKFSIPENVYIACSMNTSDRNIAFIDLAIRRRFAFIELEPNYELLSAIAEYRSFDLGNILQTINNRVLNTLGKEELMLGHSYFLSDAVKHKSDGKFYWNDEELFIQFNFVILPTLKEYTMFNRNAITTILGENLSSEVFELDDFLVFFTEEFGSKGE